MAIDFAPNSEFRARTQQFESRSFHFRGSRGNWGNPRMWPPTAPVRCLCVSVSERRLRWFSVRKSSATTACCRRRRHPENVPISSTIPMAIHFQVAPMHWKRSSSVTIPEPQDLNIPPPTNLRHAKASQLAQQINLITWLKSELHANAALMSSVSGWMKGLWLLPAKRGSQHTVVKRWALWLRAKGKGLVLFGNRLPVASGGHYCSGSGKPFWVASRNVGNEKGMQ